MPRAARLARPPRTDEWEIVAADKGAAWGTGTFEGQTFTGWQYEVTGGGRIFYFVDDPTDGGRRKPQRQARGPRPRRRVIVEAVHPGHPKATERKNR